MEIPRSTQLKALQLEALPPTYYRIIAADALKAFGEAWVRVSVSHLNARCNINLRCHKNKDGSLTVWHDPDKREQSKSTAFDKLVWLRKQMDEYRHKKNADPNPNAYLNEMLAIQDQIDAVLIELRHDNGEPRKRKGNSIRQPLSVILNFYGLTEDLWAMIPPKLQTRKRVQAEVAIKNRNGAINQ